MCYYLTDLTSRKTPVNIGLGGQRLSALNKLQCEYDKYSLK